MTIQPVRRERSRTRNVRRVATKQIKYRLLAIASCKSQKKNQSIQSLSINFIPSFSVIDLI